MPSPQHEAVVRMLESQPRPETPPTIEQMRAGFAAITSVLAVPEDVRCETVRADGVPAEWIAAPGAREDCVVLYLHGGGYVLGSPETHRALVSHVSRACRSRCLSVDYRLAPENPFPAALEDAVAAYRWLLSEGFDPVRIAVAGDSAGGGLTLATLLSLRDAGDPLPAAGVCLSPWTDLEGTGESVQDPEIGDPMIQIDGLETMRLAYLGGADPKDPRAAPLYGDYRGLPPLLIQVGTRERLLNDSTRVAQKAREAGVDVTLETGDGLVHVWQFFGPDVPESREAVQRIGEFVCNRVEPRGL